MFADGVDRDDVRMLQARFGAGLAAETCQLFGAGVAARRHHLESDQALQRDFARLVDNAHAAAAEYAENLVTGNCRHRRRHFHGGAVVAEGDRTGLRRRLIGRLF